MAGDRGVARGLFFLRESQLCEEDKRRIAKTSVASRMKIDSNKLELHDGGSAETEAELICSAPRNFSPHFKSIQCELEGLLHNDLWVVLLFLQFLERVVAKFSEIHEIL